MKKFPKIGLVVEGNITHSAILRMPKLGDDLGPVKSASVRVARRVSNFLKAGHPVAVYEEMQSAQLILLRVPDESVSRIVEEIFAADLVLKDVCFILCESWLSIESLAPLRLRGAYVGTVLPVPSSRREWFVVEGDSLAVRHIKRFLEINDARALELRPGGKPFYFAAELLSTALPIPTLLAAQTALRGSGVSGNNLYTLLNEMTQTMLRDILKGARANWTGPLAHCSPKTAGDHFEALRRADPQLADFIGQQFESARTRMDKAKGASASSAENIGVSV
jgi:predicted short-subunit dehydrogenase-like oxidoreductase (DUF2520 family)